MLRKLFGKKKGAEDTRPPLEHPKDLRLGDLLEMGLCPVPDLSGKTFEVTEVNTVDYGDGLEATFTLVADGQKFGLSVESDDEGEQLVFTKLLRRDHVLTVFDGEQFGQVFDEGTNWSSKVMACPPGYAGWLDENSYKETIDAIQGYFQKGDHRDGPLSSREEQFDFYELEGSDHRFTIEIEVYDGDETEVYACRALPFHNIERLWPKGE